MKKLILFTTACILALSIQAQITLNTGNAPSATVTQTTDYFNLVSGSFPNPSVQTNGTWDLTSLSYSGSTAVAQGAASNSNFPNATFFSTIKHFAFYNNSSYEYSARTLNAVNSGGVNTYGEQIAKQTVSLVNITGEANDKVEIDQQDPVYSSLHTSVKYPVTMGTSWTSSFNYIIKFHLTLKKFVNTPKAYSNAPGEFHKSQTNSYEVVGWGKMQVKSKDGKTSKEYDVLQVKVEETLVDSFFLEGGLMHYQVHFGVFSKQQGETTKTFKMLYLREGEVTPLAEFEYTDNTYSTVKSARVHNDRIEALGVDKIQATDINIYPNPVTNSSFTVKIDGTHKNFSYQLYSITGQVMSSGTVSANGVVTLQENIPAGNYFIKLMSVDGAYGVKQVNIIR